ncbi:MAG: transcriptional activator NhaR [Pseudomonadales bacterium]
MRHLNYNHLLYFWTVAREGSIARASQVLHLTPQTISGQLKLLEEAIGKPLFHRVGRRLVLSETGQIVNQYADDIFSLGAELAQRMRSEDPGAPYVLNVGIVNSIAKLIAYQVLEPAMGGDGKLRVVCLEGDMEKLLADLAVHRLDVVISDHPIPPGLSVKAYNHPLGESGVSFFASRRIAARYARRFPRSLDGAPMLLPVLASPLRRQLDDWFEQNAVRPDVIAEFHDSALMKAFGEAGVGLFPAPSAIATKVEAMYGARRIGDAPKVSETYYAISPERRIKHPAVLRITEHARALMPRA